MSSNGATARDHTALIFMHGTKVGSVTQRADGAVAFKYDKRYDGPSISPLFLPVQYKSEFVFPDLQRNEAFEGLPGILADALPDRFGTAVIRHALAQRGANAEAMSALHRLLYVGDYAIGALQFRAAEHDARAQQNATNQTPARDRLDLNAIINEATAVVHGRADVPIPHLARIGASLGGMRPKIFVLFNRATNAIKPGDAAREENDEDWIIKFDGVRPVGADIQIKANTEADPQPYMRIEYAYFQMARAAGIHTADAFLLEENGYAHFMSKRFDRNHAEQQEEKRIHQHTLGGMLHIDYNIPGAVSYERYIDLTTELNMSETAKDEAFRRTVFNIAAVNQDDHIKNLSLLMSNDGQWDLSPAYDLTYAKGHGWTRSHQMTVQSTRDGITRLDLATMGREQGIRDPDSIIDQVLAATGKWEEFASKALVPAPWIERVRSDMSSCGV